MKIEWNNLSNEERDRVVCEAVGIKIEYDPRGEDFDLVPAVSTDANEAWNVLGALQGTVVSIRHMKGGVLVRIRSTENQSKKTVVIYGIDFCHAICVAALQSKGIEVAL